MHSFRIAEWLLALVTTRDRAAATVGDLAERAATRGGVWFWSGVLRTAASLMWRDIAEHPARITGLALLGVYTGMLLLFGFLDGIVFFTAAYLSGKDLPLDFTGWKIWLAAPVLFGSLLVGRMLARWGPGRELAACVIFAILAALCNLSHAPLHRWVCSLVGRSHRSGRGCVGTRPQTSRNPAGIPIKPNYFSTSPANRVLA
ncbi:MAG TPA: hypothetical protein VGG72_01220 [Bryobacteraceae bacterium]|jgi:hypothetical protein